MYLSKDLSGIWIYHLDSRRYMIDRFITTYVPNTCSQCIFDNQSKVTYIHTYLSSLIARSLVSFQSSYRLPKRLLAKPCKCSGYQNHQPSHLSLFPDKNSRCIKKVYISGAFRNRSIGSRYLFAHPHLRHLPFSPFSLPAHASTSSGVPSTGLLLCPQSPSTTPARPYRDFCS